MSYFQVDVRVLQFALSHQRPLYRTELCAFGDPSLGKDSAQEAVDIQDERKTGPSLGHHRAAEDGVQRAVFYTCSRISIITVFTPYT